jgi:hypothetical protein
MAFIIFVGWFRKRRAPKLSESKFIKQVISNSVDSSPKAEPRDKGGFPYIHLEQVTEMGGAACLIYGHIFFHWLF